MHDRDPGSDGRVIRRSLAEPHAFGTIFERHFDALYGYACRRVGSHLGEEIATETFVRAFDGRRRFDVQCEDARPWLLGIAANLLRRHWRTERRRLTAYSRSAGPEQSAPAASSRADLVAALDSISKDERETLFLYAVADLSYEEIGAALRIPVGTVRSRLARARARLRERLGNQEIALPSSCDTKESFNV